jgi:hypothetical protein
VAKNQGSPGPRSPWLRPPRPGASASPLLRQAGKKAPGAPSFLPAKWGGAILSHREGWRRGDERSEADAARHIQPQLPPDLFRGPPTEIEPSQPTPADPGINPGEVGCCDLRSGKTAAPTPTPHPKTHAKIPPPWFSAYLAHARYAAPKAALTALNPGGPLTGKGFGGSEASIFACIPAYGIDTHDI